MIESFAELENAMKRGNLNEVLELSDPHPLEAVFKAIGLVAIHRWQEYGEGKNTWHFLVSDSSITLDISINIKRMDKEKDG